MRAYSARQQCYGAYARGTGAAKREQKRARACSGYEAAAQHAYGALPEGVLHSSVVKVAVGLRAKEFAACAVLAKGIRAARSSAGRTRGRRQRARGMAGTESAASQCRVPARLRPRHGVEYALRHDVA